jgi:release factor glutamine methyltransferase
MDKIINALESDAFQETILQSTKPHLAPYLMKLNNFDLVLFPKTFNPCYAKPALFFLKYLGIKRGDVVLDPFTGCGADAIFAIHEGASRVVASDKFTMPFLCTKYNVEMLGLKSKIDVRQGDLFGALKKGEKFDLIVANPPFKEEKAESEIVAAIHDPHYETLTRFFKEARNHLKLNGRIRMVFADIGDINFLQKLATENGFKIKIIAQTKYAFAIRIIVYEFT